MIALNCNKTVAILRTSWIKFIGSIVNYPVFNQDSKLMKRVVDEFFLIKDSTNMQISTRGSWSLANLASAKNVFYSLEISQQAKIVLQLLMYTENSKEKIQSNAM